MKAFSPILLVWFVLMFSGSGVLAAEQNISSWECYWSGNAEPSEADPFGLQGFQPSRRIELFEFRPACDAADPDQLPPKGEFACRVKYDHYDDSRILWNARYNRDYCAKRVYKLVEELSGAGLTCYRKDAEVPACGTTGAEPAVAEPPASPAIPEAYDIPETVAAPAEPAAPPTREEKIRDYLVKHVDVQFVRGIMKHVPKNYVLSQHKGRTVISHAQYGAQAQIDFAAPTIREWDLNANGNDSDVIITAYHKDGQRVSNVHYMFLNIGDGFHFVGSVIGGKLETDFSGQLFVTELAGIPNSCPPEIIAFRVKLDPERQVSALADGIMIGRRPNEACSNREDTSIQIGVGD